MLWAFVLDCAAEEMNELQTQNTINTTEIPNQIVYECEVYIAE